MAALAVRSSDFFLFSLVFSLEKEDLLHFLSLSLFLPKVSRMEGDSDDTVANTKTRRKRITGWAEKRCRLPQP